VEELPPLGLAIEVSSTLSTLHKDFLWKEKVLDPYLELRLVSQDLDEVPLGCLPILLDTVEKFQGDCVGGST